MIGSLGGVPCTFTVFSPLTLLIFIALNFAYFRTLGETSTHTPVSLP